MRDPESNVLEFVAGFIRHLSFFGIFQRLHRETEFDGVGAGLAVCRAIAERHGAYITATAAVGQGCTVRVEWPVAALAAEAAQEPGAL